MYSPFQIFSFNEKGTLPPRAMVMVGNPTVFCPVNKASAGNITDSATVLLAVATLLMTASASVIPLSNPDKPCNVGSKRGWMTLC
jgi:hypothetical protein